MVRLPWAANQEIACCSYVNIRRHSILKDILYLKTLHIQRHCILKDTVYVALGALGAMLLLRKRHFASEHLSKARPFA